MNANGVIYAYTVSSRRANSTDEWMNRTQYEPNLSYELTGLMKFVVYSIKVRAITVKGFGPFSEPVHQRSDEDGKCNFVVLKYSVSEDHKTNAKIIICIMLHYEE